MVLYIVFVILAVVVVSPRVPVRWSFLSLVLMANLSFAGPHWHSMTTINLPNALRVVILPAVLLLRYYLSQKPHLGISNFGVYFLLFVAYVALATLWSPVPIAAVKELGYLLSFLFTAVLATFLFRESRSFLLGRLPIVALGSIVIAIWQTYISARPFSQYDGSLTSFSPKNAFAIWLVFCEVLLLTLAASPGTRRLLTMGTAFFLAAAQVANSSRAPLLAGTLVAMLALGLSGVFWKATGRRGVQLCAISWVAGAALMVVLLLAVPSLLPAGRSSSVLKKYREGQKVGEAYMSSIRKRPATAAPNASRKPKASRKPNIRRVKNLSFRITRWKRAMHELETRSALTLLTGSGTSSSVTLVKVSDVFRWHGDKTLIDANRVLHNAFLRVAVEWGLVGMILFFGLVAKITVASLKLISARTNLIFPMIGLGLLPFGVILLFGNPLASSGIPSGMGIALWVALLVTSAPPAVQRASEKGMQAQRANK